MYGVASGGQGDITDNAVHFVSKPSNWHCTQVTSPATEVPGSHIVGSFDLAFTGDMKGKAHCTLVMTAYGKQLANGHKPNDFGEFPAEHSEQPCFDYGWRMQSPR